MPSHKAPKRPPAKSAVSHPTPPIEANATVPQQQLPKGRTPFLLRGMRDILPGDRKYWVAIESLATTLAQQYGFERLDPPLLESTSLFVRSIGEYTDVVEKEMFTLHDRSGDSMSLRPEATAGIVRAFIEHGMLNLPQPVKLWTLGPMFRYDRPQAGRQRQFHQFDYEVIGDMHPVIDAQMILLAYTLLTELGLDVTIQVNSLGDPESRKEYLKKLTEYFRSKRKDLTEEQRERLKRNPLRLLDTSDDAFRELTADAPQMVDHLSDEARKHFIAVLEHLDALDVPYELNPRLVRGLDYYTRTTFEIWETQGDGAGQSALLGGGRYDRLVGLLGGRPTPAIGFAGGIERIINALKAKGVAVPELPRPDLFVAQLGDAARKKALKLFELLRHEHFTIAENLSKDSLKTQLGNASRVGAVYALILGQKEILDGTVLIRDMESGIQETVSYDRIVVEMRKRIAQRANHQQPPVRIVDDTASAQTHVGTDGPEPPLPIVGEEPEE